MWDAHKSGCFSFPGCACVLFLAEESIISLPDPCPIIHAQCVWKHPRRENMHTPSKLWYRVLADSMHNRSIPRNARICNHDTAPCMIHAFRLLQYVRTIHVCTMGKTFSRNYKLSGIYENLWKQAAWKHIRLALLAWGWRPCVLHTGPVTLYCIYAHLLHVVCAYIYSHIHLYTHIFIYTYIHIQALYSDDTMLTFTSCLRILFLCILHNRVAANASWTWWRRAWCIRTCCSRRSPSSCTQAPQHNM